LWCSGIFSEYLRRNLPLHIALKKFIKLLCVYILGGQGFIVDVIGAKSARCDGGGPSISASCIDIWGDTISVGGLVLEGRLSPTIPAAPICPRSPDAGVLSPIRAGNSAEGITSSDRARSLVALLRVSIVKAR